MNRTRVWKTLIPGAVLLLAAAAQALSAPVFSVPGFVDEVVHTGNGMITVRFDSAGRMWVIEKQGRVLMFEPNSGAATTVAYEYYEKPAAAPAWTQIPDFSAPSSAVLVKSGTAATYDLEPRERDDDFAFRFRGRLEVTTPGVHTFYLTSDDGSRLYVDDELVVDHDGTHGNTEKSGSVELAEGLHDIRVEYFEAGGGQGLEVEYESPGMARGPLASGPFKPPVIFADYRSQVDTAGERGMLGLAIDPDFASNRYLYVLFSTSSDQRILRLTANETFTGVAPGGEKLLLSGLPNVNNVHKAGDIAFRPGEPNSLYVMLGDDGDRTQVGSLSIYNGKLLRIDSADGRGVSSNPHHTGDGNNLASRIWSSRYRNPYRFDFDPAVPTADVLYISENGDGTDRLARIVKGGDGGWDNQFYVDSGDGKRKILQTSAPSKTGIAIVRDGPLAPGGLPTLYNARYGGGTRNEVRRWQLTGADLDALTPLAADSGQAFYQGYENRGIVDFELGPDGALYYTDSGQGASTGTGFRIGRIRFVGGTEPVAAFAVAQNSGPTPFGAVFTDTSTAPDSSIVTRLWDFGDGTTSSSANPSHTYATPGVYTVSLTVTNAEGLTDSTTQTVTAYHPIAVTLTGTVADGRTLAGDDPGVATEVRVYQADGVTPASFPGGTGPSGNVIAVPAGAVISASLFLQITGPGIVVSAGEPAADGMQSAFVGVPLSTTAASQDAEVEFRLSDTMLRGRVLDTLGQPARVDIGVSRGTAGNFYAFLGGRDFRPSAGRDPVGVNHRVVADALGYFHIPISTGGGNADFLLDTTADTRLETYGRVHRTVTVSQGTGVLADLTVGLYDGSTGEADLSGIAETPNIDFATQIQPIFTASCAACHNEIATNSGGLDLQAGASYDELVNQVSVEARGVKLVDPGDPERSYLMEKINSTHPQVGTNMRPGDPMPLVQRALIRDWISQLASSGKIEFTHSGYVVQEGTASALVDVRRRGGVEGSVSVSAGTTNGGSATAGADYTPNSVTLTWAAGERGVQTMAIPILDDALAEGAETVGLRISAPGGGAALGLLTGTELTIGDRPFDAWRFEKFGEQANSAEAQPDADFDADGLRNLLEYALRLDPRTASASGIEIAPHSSGRLEFSFTRNVEALGLRYQVTASSDLIANSWTVLAEKIGGADWTVSPGVAVQDDAPTGEVTVRDDVLIDGPSSRFLRLEVERTTD